MTALTEALSDAIGRGLAASRPAAGIAGRLYIASDTGDISRDNGSTWDTLALLSALTVKDEGGALATAATSLDFVGDGVTASGTGAAKTITVPGVTGAGLIAVTAYNPSGSNTKVITTTADADVDATNFKVTFTAPASGNVIVKASCLFNDSTSGACNAHWTIRESTTTLADNYVSSQLAKAVRANATFYITGISAGSHTYKLGAYRNAGTNMTFYYGTTDPFGPFIMEVYAAP